MENMNRYDKIMKETFRDIKIPEMSVSFEADFYRKLEERQAKPSFIGRLRFGIPARLSLAGSVLVLVFVILMKPYTGFIHKKDTQAISRTNGDVFMEVAVSQSNRVDQQNMVDSQSMELLRNLL